MVAPATRRFSHSWWVCGVRDVGRVSERSLHVRPISVAILFAGDLWRSAHVVVRRKAWVVAGVAPVFPGADHPAVSRPVSFYVLLLSRRILQSVLGGSAELRRGRAALELHR